MAFKRIIALLDAKIAIKLIHKYLNRCYEIEINITISKDNI